MAVSLPLITAVQETKSSMELEFPTSKSYLLVIIRLLDFNG